MEIAPHEVVAWAESIGYSLPIDTDTSSESLAKFCSGQVGKVLAQLVQRSVTRHEAKRVRRTIQEEFHHDPLFSSPSFSVHSNALPQSTRYNTLKETTIELSNAQSRRANLVSHQQKLAQDIQKLEQESHTQVDSFQLHAIKCCLFNAYAADLRRLSDKVATYQEFIQNKPARVQFTPDQYDCLVKLTKEAVSTALTGESDIPSASLQAIIQGIDSISTMIRISSHKTKSSIETIQDLSENHQLENPDISFSINSIRKKHVDLLQQTKNKQNEIEQLAVKIQLSMSKIDRSKREAALARANKRGYTASLHHLRTKIDELRREIAASDVPPPNLTAVNEKIASTQVSIQQLLDMRTRLHRELTNSQRGTTEFVQENILQLKARLKSLTAMLKYALEEEIEYMNQKYFSLIYDSFKSSNPLFCTSQEWWKTTTEILSIPHTASLQTVLMGIKDLHVSSGDSSGFRDMWNRKLRQGATIAIDAYDSLTYSSPEDVRQIAEIALSKQERAEDEILSIIEAQKSKLANLKQTLDEIHTHAQEDRLRLFSGLGGDIDINGHRYIESYKNAMGA